ncbi:glycosyltransferase [Oleidesulfovibrio sp.]|uniref:glycosyltransferase family 2 protein n=1 Tax=Oleidesulfovibrio sp. TaxID=2909707 RepID=UPI003A8A04A8
MTTAFFNAASCWRRFPAFLREHLLHGSVGSFHLMQAASETLGAMNQAAPADKILLWHTGRELLLAAWEDDCLNCQLAGQLVELDGHARKQEGRPWLSQQLHDALSALHNAGGRPENLRYYERLASQGDYERCIRYLDGERGKQPENIWWVQQVCAVGELTGRLEWSKDHLARYAASAPPQLLPILEYAAAGIDISAGNMHGAGEALQRILPSDEALQAGMLLGAAERLGHVMLHSGDRHRALDLWGAVLQARPFHTGLAMRMHAVRNGFDSPENPASLGKVAALLYSYNKAGDLDQAFRHLAQSADLLQTIIALDNGSTDTEIGGTGAVIDAWVDRLAGKAQAIHLPVNIGAPAARNWLMHLPQVAECDYAAYLDDDAALPPDWLGHMARAVQVRPQASVWGGKIIDFQAPHIIQSADLHLIMAGTEQDSQEERNARAQNSLASTSANPFNVSELHAQVADYGQFDYIRPCISVTGCCHMFRTADLLDSGDFSLMLSPSQYDDFEHDLRMATQGRHACYTGFLSVRHMKRTGKATRMSAAQYGNGMGNKYKLHNMYPPDEIIRLRRSELDMLEQDLLRVFTFA